MTNSELMQQVLEIVHKYIDLTGAILDDNLIDSGTVTEMGAADQNLLKDIAALDVAQTETEEFEAMLERLKELEFDSVDHYTLLDFVDEEISIRDWLVEKGYAVVKIESKQAADKLEEFVKTEPCPFYNDQKDKLFV